MTESQLSEDDLLGWVRERLGNDCEVYETNNCVLDQMYEAKLIMADILYVLRNATQCSQTYDGGCFVVRGHDVDGRRVAVVVAPPSSQNRVRVVKVWLGE